MDRMTSPQEAKVNTVIHPDDLKRARQVVDQIYIDDKIKDYIVDIIFATREPGAYKLDRIRDFIQYGASPRASIFLNRAARAHAFLRHRGHVMPEDVKAVAPDVLRHRILLTYEAEAEEKKSEDILQIILDEIGVP